jgi:hypothetical protein
MSPPTARDRGAEAAARGVPHRPAGRAVRAAAAGASCPARSNEGLTFPGQVNYVAKGANLIARLHADRRHRRRHPASQHHLPVGQGARAGRRLWRLVGVRQQFGVLRVHLLSRPQSARHHRQLRRRGAYLKAGVGEQDLVRSIIGVIGAIDTYRLPDAKGFASMMFELTGETDETRQQRREEVLGSSTRTSPRWPTCSTRWPAAATWWCWAQSRRSRPPTTSAVGSSR